jgi:hypothetical protein
LFLAPKAQHLTVSLGQRPTVLSENQMPALKARFAFGGILLNRNISRIGTRFQRSWLIG